MANVWLIVSGSNGNPIIITINVVINAIAMITTTIP
jgi:hypothetical protein